MAPPPSAACSTGPHPFVENVSARTRRRQVDWGTIDRELDRVFREDPECEEAYQLKAASLFYRGLP